MTKNVINIDFNETIYDACKIYSECKVGSLVVIDKDMIVGIVTERDIIERIILMNKDPKKIKVHEIMSHNIKTIHATANIEKAAIIMKENNIKKLPVILNNEIVGIITETDILRAVYAFSETIEHLSELYDESRKNIGNMMDKWGSIISNLKNYKEISNK